MNKDVIGVPQKHWKSARTTFHPISTEIYKFSDLKLGKLKMCSGYQHVINTILLHFQRAFRWYQILLRTSPPPPHPHGKYFLSGFVQFTSHIFYPKNLEICGQTTSLLLTVQCLTCHIPNLRWLCNLFAPYKHGINCRTLMLWTTDRFFTTPHEPQCRQHMIHTHLTCHFKISP